MILTLEVTGEQAQSLGVTRKVFKAIGGTIGRLPDNDWVFADPYVSGRHALIRYVNGKYFIEDTSTNGVFINSPESRVGRSQAQQLNDGDTLFIDAYKIKVSIKSDPEKKAEFDPFAPIDPKSTNLMRKPAPPQPEEEDRTASLGRSESDEEEDEESEEHEAGDRSSTEWYGISDSQVERPKQPNAVAPSALTASPVTQMMPPPVRSLRSVPTPERVVARAAQAVPATRPSASPIPIARARAEAESSPATQLEALLEAAGIEGLDANAETAQVLGEILRTAVSGVMDVLRARERMKDDLRMRGTTFKVAHNNPLKFSANTDDAFHNLLVKRNAAYLQPGQAFEDAFSDLRDHQNAIMAAMRLAFEAMLAQFDPERLQEDFDRQIRKGSILGVPAKLRYWDLFRDKFTELTRDADSSFRTLFGDEFAKAYEEQLARSKAMPRKD
jgi:type VI secretion system protein ImpI